MILVDIIEATLAVAVGGLFLHTMGGLAWEHFFSSH